MLCWRTRAGSIAASLSSSSTAIPRSKAVSFRECRYRSESPQRPRARAPGLLPLVRLESCGRDHRAAGRLSRSAVAGSSFRCHPRGSSPHEIRRVSRRRARTWWCPSLSTTSAASSRAIFSAAEFAAAGLESTVAESSIAYNRARADVARTPLPGGARTRKRSSSVARVGRSTTSSWTFGRTRRRSRHWHAVELSARNRRALYVPPGTAHGYLTLEDDTRASVRDLATARSNGCQRRALGRPAVQHRLACAAARDRRARCVVSRLLAAESVIHCVAV